MVGIVTLGRPEGVEDDEDGAEDEDVGHEEEEVEGRKVFTRGRGRAVLGTLPPLFVAGGCEELLVEDEDDAVGYDADGEYETCFDLGPLGLFEIAVSSCMPSKPRPCTSSPSCMLNEKPIRSISSSSASLSSRSS